MKNLIEKKLYMSQNQVEDRKKIERWTIEK